MENEIMAVCMFAISWCLYAEAYLAAPILIRRGFTPTGRHAFIVFAIAMGTYMGWIGILFLQDRLAPVNYEWSIITIRLAVLVSLIVLLVKTIKER